MLTPQETVDNQTAQLQAFLDPENPVTPWGQFFTAAGEAAHGQTVLNEINCALKDVEHKIYGAEFEIEEIEHDRADEFFDRPIGTLKALVADLELERAYLKNEQYDVISLMFDQVSPDKSLAEKRREWKLEGGAGEVGDNFEHELGILIFSRLAKSLKVPTGQASPQLYWTWREAWGVEGMLWFLIGAEALEEGELNGGEIIASGLRRAETHSRDVEVGPTFLTMHPVWTGNGHLARLTIKSHARTRRSASSDRRQHSDHAHRRPRRGPRTRQRGGRAAVRVPGSRRATPTSGSDPGGGGNDGPGDGQLRPHRPSVPLRWGIGGPSAEYAR